MIWLDKRNNFLEVSFRLLKYIVEIISLDNLSPTMCSIL